MAGTDEDDPSNSDNSDCASEGGHSFAPTHVSDTIFEERDLQGLDELVTMVAPQKTGKDIASEQPPSSDLAVNAMASQSSISISSSSHWGPEKEVYTRHLSKEPQHKRE